MHYLLIILRFLHVVGGAFWFGSSMMMGFFVGPAVAAIGDAGPKFMGHVILKAKLHTVIAISAGLTVLAGLGLYWIDSEGFTSAWTRSGPGIVFGIGAFFGLIGFIFGNLLGINIKKVVTTGSQIQGKPTAEQLSQIQTAQKTMSTAGPISSYALIVALVCMSVARYWF
jgi:hypothetical protein